MDAKLLELAKIHIDDNGADMMAKTLPRGKFKACCEIVGLAVTSTLFEGEICWVFWAPFLCGGNAQMRWPILSHLFKWREGSD